MAAAAVSRALEGRRALWKSMRPAFPNNEEPEALMKIGGLEGRVFIPSPKARASPKAVSLQSLFGMSGMVGSWWLHQKGQLKSPDLC